ncbi:MAG: dephospho-CoA kinase [Desulfovibrio sp.]|jgi:23S rRNA pseudouridine1911/1915/1917 synthase|nr:dephospho-CoA kinase [Desulfovibrio sp.]
MMPGTGSKVARFNAEQGAARLDAFLARHAPFGPASGLYPENPANSAETGRKQGSVLGRGETLSRETIKKLIRAGKVRVNGEAVLSPKAPVPAGAEIELSVPAPSSPLTPESGPLRILYRDAVLAVIDKEAGLTTHPAPGRPEGTLAHRLLLYFPELAAAGGPRPGIVHRLDKDTGGLMLIALNETCRLALAQHFAERKIFKEYLALVYGVPKPPIGRINAPVGRDPAHKTRMAVTASGRPAESAYRVLYADPAGHFALTSVRIFTGRTHQVRVHMRSIGHPLIGDSLYSDPRRAAAGKRPPHPASDRKLPYPFMPGRQMLHAHKLAFVHPFPEALNHAALCGQALSVAGAGDGAGAGAFCRVSCRSTSLSVAGGDADAGASCRISCRPTALSNADNGADAGVALRVEAGEPELRFVCPPPADFTDCALSLARRALRVVLTGSPGCGKSSLSALFAEEKGIPVFSADRTVAELYEAGGDAAYLLRARYGDRFVPGAGACVDKKVLGDAMRADAVLHREVEALVHPMVYHALEAFRTECDELGLPFAVAEIPLYFETGGKHDKEDVVTVGVHCPFPIRRERLLRLRGWSDAVIAGMESRQWPEDKKTAACDVVADNSGSLEDLGREAKRLAIFLNDARAARDAALTRMFAAFWDGREVRSGFCRERSEGTRGQQGPGRNAGA